MIVWWGTAFTHLWTQEYIFGLSKFPITSLVLFLSYRQFISLVWSSILFSSLIVVSLAVRSLSGRTSFSRSSTSAWRIRLPLHVSTSYGSHLPCEINLSVNLLWRTVEEGPVQSFCPGLQMCILLLLASYFYFPDRHPHTCLLLLEKSKSGRLSCLL